MATVGGVLSANDSGTLRLRFGALRDLIIGVTIALPDGTLASSGTRSSVASCVAVAAPRDRVQ